MNTTCCTRRIPACLVGFVLFAFAPIVHAAAPREQTLQVFAAASLAQAFGYLANRFEAAHPGVRVRLNLAGSQQLAAQIEQGAPADVFASADGRWMADLAAHQRINGEPVVFAHNTLIVITPRTNPVRMARLQDLGRPGVKLVIGADAVPVGHYSRELLQRLSRCEGFDAGFAKRSLANVVSEEENVKAVIGKVQLGEADAGICYRSDTIGPVARYLRLWPIPDTANVVASYTIAIIAGTRQPEVALRFVELVRSSEGRARLVASGFLPALPVVGEPAAR